MAFISFSSKSVTTPLQLTMISQLLQNAGIKTLPADLVTAINSFNSTALIGTLKLALERYPTLSFFSKSVYDQMLTVGRATVAGLGNSIPAIYTYLSDYYLNKNYITYGETSSLRPAGLSVFVNQAGEAYFGNGNAAKFLSGYCAVFGFKQTVNQFITSAVNSTEYLGPILNDDMDGVITSNISQVNALFDKFGIDVQKQGTLVDTSNLDLYGTPAGLLQQINKVGNLTPPLIELLKINGMSDQDINNLVTNNRVSIDNPNGITDNQFDTLQKMAYRAFSLLDGNELTELLEILDVTTPNITSGEQLFDPEYMFPLSYKTLTVPTTTGPQYIYLDDGSVNFALAPIVDQFLLAATGCDELSKIIPKPTAIANKAIQVGLQNIPGISNITWPEFSELIYANSPESWDPTKSYLPNTVVSFIPNDLDLNKEVQPGVQTPVTNYQSLQDVPPGIDINNSDYWRPTFVGGALQTLSGLPLVESLSPQSNTASDFFADQVATGSGEYGTILMTDIIGLVIDINNLADKFTSAATAINNIADYRGPSNPLSPVPEYTQLLSAYSAMLAATSNAAMLLAITDAETAITNLVNNYPAPHPIAQYISSLDAAWVAICQAMNKEMNYQTQSGFYYFYDPDGETSSIYSLVNILPQYVQDDVPNGGWDLLNKLFDKDTFAGQSGIAALRETYNLQRIDAAGVSTAAAKIPVGSVPGGNFVTPNAEPTLLDNYPAARQN